MKSLNQFIIEKLKISKRKKTKHTLFPKDKDELSYMIDNELAKNGLHCSLNHIDTSKITDMSKLFQFTKFNGDISEWNVSNVTNMHSMFAISHFNGDISDWDVSSVEIMNYMFADSEFNQDISNWDISNVKTMTYMFGGCPIKENYKPKLK